MSLQRPEIIYKTVVINKNNVDSVLATRRGGYYNYEKNEIVLFKYVMSDDIPQSKKTDVLYLVNYAKESKDKTIFHEMQHWQNYELCPLYYDNYYMDIYNDCLDEVSALTAGFIHDDSKYKLYGVKQDIVVCSMATAAHIFLHYYFDKYKGRFVNSILRARKNGEDETPISQLKKWNNKYKNNPDALFDKDFYNVTNHYFTYDGYCIFDDKIYEYTKDVWNLANENIKQIKQKSMDKTYQMIDTIIKESR